MDIRQLEYFVAVAEELNFTRAAQRVFAVQSTVSAAIRALEADLGAVLFERSTRSVALSPAGAALLPEAKTVLETLDRARAAVQETTTGLRGSVRIGSLTSIAVIDLPALLGAFHQRHPLVDLHVTASPEGSTGLARDLRRSRLDVALIGLPDSELAGLDVRPVVRIPFVALLPESHPLAERAEIDPADLVGERFVDTLRGFGNRLAVDRVFEALAAPRRVVVEVSDLTTVPGHVRAGLGVAVVPRIAASQERGLVSRPLAGSPLVWTLHAATLAGRRPSRAVAALLDLLDDHVLRDTAF
ncbi:LysR family transcriptional regulator [Umezawaea beigongshangensis]|uniref:LysR family transcriptional regulator n=1 Tax=Umezawaea beigongshangensis TaxID=2780383 RepID=UPI0018F136A6|nr:LysR family transcriptional regulator [Umezawaea beigongshangensis]